jgi:hypothetical protein
MALAVTTKVKTLNPAFTTGIISPNSNKVMMYAYALGLLLPLVFFFIKNALDTYVHTKNDILNAVNDIPVVGEIPTIQKGASMVIGKNDLSSFAESFRILVSNTKYFLIKKTNVQ